MAFEHPLLARWHREAPPEGQLDGRRWVALWFISASILIIGIDATVVGVAAPALTEELGATTSDVQWVFDAFTVVLAGVVLFGGGLADRVGRKGVFLAGLAVFGAGSLLAALAASPGMLIGARAVTGFGAALLMPPALSLLGVLFPPEERARAIAIWAAVAGIGIALGPVVAGVLLDHFWFGSVFLINLPVVVVALVGAAVYLPTSRRPGSGGLDAVGALLSVVGLGVFVWGIIEAPTRGWLDPVTLGSTVAGLGLIGCFVGWELRSHAPLFDVRVFRLGPVLTGGLVVGTIYLTFYGMQLVLPQYLQYVEGHDTVVTGLLLLPLGLIFLAVSPASAPLTARFGDRRMLTAGFTSLIAGTLALAGIDRFGGYGIVLVGLSLYSVGWAVVMAPATAAIMNVLPVDKAGDGSAVNQVSRQIGGALGIAVLGSIYATVYRGRLHLDGLGLSGAEAEAARSSVGGAQQVAATLGEEPGRALEASAAEAMTRGAEVTFLVAAAVAVAVLACGLRVLRPGRVAAS